MLSFQDMAGNYTVQQGDFMSSIAKAFGFPDYRSIWFHPANAQLKQLRQNPNVLFPGDVVFVPDRAPRIEPRPTDQLHKFVKHAPPLKLRLTLEDQYEKPIAAAPCILTIEGNSQQLTTDAKGALEQEIPPDAHNASLVINDPQTPYQSVQFAILIGSLDPVEEPSGQAGRLTNLGYYFEDVQNIDAAAFSSAVEEFQCDHSLTVDGVCGPNTQAKLKQVHGC
jgi:hypothetical protein